MAFGRGLNQEPVLDNDMSQSIRQPGLTKKLPGVFLKQVTAALIVLALPEELRPLALHLLCQVLSWFKGVTMCMTLLLRVLLCLEKTFQSRKEMVRFLWRYSSTHPIESGQPCHSGLSAGGLCKDIPFPILGLLIQMDLIHSDSCIVSIIYYPLCSWTFGLLPFCYVR